MKELAEIEAVIEAALFATPEPLPRKRILELFSDREQQAVLESIERVLGRYEESEGRGVRAEEVAGGLRLVTRPELHGYLKRLFDLSGRNRLSMAALETLAIIAYRQPITAPEIQELRGVNSSGVLKTLLERRLIRISGRKMVVGKPFLYCSTRDFLMQFGLRALDELPALEDFEDLIEQMEADGGRRDERTREAEEIFGPEAIADPDEPGSASETSTDEEE